MSLRVTAIIAAYNEEQTLASVLAPLRAHPQIEEIIVVSDGSTDGTVEVARAEGARTIALRSNQGKGYAMRVGVEHATGNVLFFVDADMLHLTSHHIDSLIGPVMAGRTDMNVGVRHRDPVRNFLHLRMHIGPVLSGIRVMTRGVFYAVPTQFMERFKIELALNYFCRRAGFRQMTTVVRNLGHVIKEQKRGFGDGLAGRAKMTREVALLHLDLYIFQSWKWGARAERPAVEFERFDAL